MATTPSPLLELPAELRIIVYERILVVNKDDEVDVDQACSYQPALLRTCSQIQQEALPIFYKKNHFWLNLNDDLSGPHPKHWIWIAKSLSPFLFINLGEEGFEFDELLPWLRLCHAGQLKMDNFVTWNYGEREDIIDNAFEIAATSTKLPWDKVEKILRIYASAINIATSRNMDSTALWGDVVA